MNTKEKAIKFLTEKVGEIENVRNAYGSEKEMMYHLLSGEVTIPFTDAVNYISELIGECNLPSRYSYGDKVLFGMQPSDGGWLCPVTGVITGVHFFRSKVKYDLELGSDQDKTRIYNVDSLYVQPFTEEAYKCYSINRNDTHSGS